MAIKFAIHLTPRSGRDCVLGYRVTPDDKCEICVSVTAPPENGKANKAVCKLLAKELNCPKTKVNVIKGQTSRHKLVEAAVDTAAFEQWKAQLSLLS